MFQVTLRFKNAAQIKIRMNVFGAQANRLAVFARRGGEVALNAQPRARFP
jgi:hypothetical protein